MDRIDQLLRGMGCIDDVTDALLSQHGETSQVYNAIKWSSINLMALIDIDACPECAVVLACAVLNESFVKTGMLFSIDSTGVPGIHVVSDKTMRDVLSSGMGLQKRNA